MIGAHAGQVAQEHKQHRSTGKAEEGGSPRFVAVGCCASGNILCTGRSFLRLIPTAAILHFPTAAQISAVQSPLFLAAATPSNCPSPLVAAGVGSGRRLVPIYFGLFVTISTDQQKRPRMWEERPAAWWAEASRGRASARQVVCQSFPFRSEGRGSFDVDPRQSIQLVAGPEHGPSLK